MRLKFKKLSFLFFGLSICSFVRSQDTINAPFIIKGLVYDSASKVSLPFATVIDQSTKVATITNAEGYFELNIQSTEDTIEVSYLGYKKRRIETNSRTKVYKIGLEANTFNLSPVEVFTKSYSFIYDLIIAAKEKQSKQIKDAKVYYQLKSYIDGNQIELVENFYNARIQGYDLLSLKLKAGRLGLKKSNDSYFASLESSKPIKMHRLFSESNFFPHSPLEFNKRQMEKKYYLDLEKAYLDENNDSILIASFYPKKSKLYHFNTRVWINASDTNLVKVEFEGKDILKFPLVPIYEEDELSEINLKITKTFEEINDQLFFKHIDFNYDFNYTKGYGESVRVKTEAVLFSYDYDQTFKLPITNLNDSKLTDYQKLSAMPYNDFFWNQNDELSLHYEIDSNQIFMQDELTISNVRELNSINLGLSEFFNYPIIQWKKNRFSLKELPQNKAFIIGQPNYKLETQLFLDYNEYNDSINVLLRSIFDVYNSYYRYYIDNETVCFMNMYFDLVELERRSLESKIEKSDKSWGKINRLFSESQLNLKRELSDFLDEVGLGKNQEQMKLWNDIIRKKLKIDNISTFKLNEE